MTNDERQHMLRTMYLDDEKPAATGRMPSIETARSRKIRVGAIEYEVPSLEYVSRLERIVAQQGRMLEQQRRMLNRLINRMTAARGVINRHDQHLHEVRQELDKKIDQWE